MLRYRRFHDYWTVRTSGRADDGGQDSVMRAIQSRAPGSMREVKRPEKEAIDVGQRFCRRDRRVWRIDRLTDSIFLQGAAKRWQYPPPAEYLPPNVSLPAVDTPLDTKR